MRRRVALLAVLAAPAAAHAGTVSGTIRAQSGGTPLAGCEVRAWLLDSKGATLTQTVSSDGAGNYTLNLAAGTYKVDSRGPASGGNYTDRWYDVAAPFGSGYVGEDADALAVTGSSAATGIDISLEVGGGLDGRVMFGGSPLVGPIARMERNADPRIHHNDFADPAPQTGVASFRGLPPAADYQMIIYDPSGVRDTLLVAGPFNVSSGVDGSYGDRTMASYPADPYEGNNTANCGATAVDEDLLHASPPQPWATSNARIGPLAAGDVDWFCFQAVRGDRLLLTASTAFIFGGATRYHPWTDPLLSWWSGARVVKLAEDDDSGPGHFDSFIDTGPLDAGCHCAGVTTFGDPNYTGAGQQSTGRFTLTFQMGNRPPALRVRKGGTDVPEAPQTLVIAEGQELALLLDYPDLEGDAVVPTFLHRDNTATDVTGGTLNLGGGSGDYTWTAGASAALLSPYSIVVTAADAEFNTIRNIILQVTAVNDPPGAPVLISPIDGAVTASATPTLTIGNATDPDADALDYDIELYFGDTAGPAAQTATVTEGIGQTTWVPAAINENTRVFWRARADDGNGGLSPWTDFEDFLVDSFNDPPEAPVLIKPGEGEIVMGRRPGLSVLNPTDPEDEALTILYEVAVEPTFATPVWSSGLVPMNTASSTTMATVDVDLAWGGEYFARALAEDSRGGQSPWSNLRHFRIKDNLPPGAPGLEGECQSQNFSPDPPSSFTVVNPVDPEGETVTLELEIHLHDDDPEAVPPLVTASVEMDAGGTSTAIPFDGSALTDGHYRWRVRATDGELTSDWISCDFFVVLGMVDSGGCCRSGGPGGALPLALLVLVLVSRRRSSRP